MVYQIWVITILILLFSYFLTKKIHKKNQPPPPPSPPSLPIIGHLHLVTKQPLIHRTFQHLSSKYGPIFSLNLGFLPCIIISSPKAVQQCFTQNDVVLANRPKVLVGKHLHYNYTTLGAASYGRLWLTLRKVSNQELLSSIRMNSFTHFREEEVRFLVKGLFGLCKENMTMIKMNMELQGLLFNILTRVLTGKRYYEYGGGKIGGNEEAGEFFGIMREAFELNAVASSMADVLPFLRRFDNVEGRMMKVRGKMDEFLDGVIEECRRNKNGGSDEIMISRLLNLQELEPENYSNDFIKGIIMIMLTAGTDTSSATLEWALALLINHPNILEKAREHINNYKQTSDEPIEESDLPQLPYIQCIINETLRLFPVAPLLVSHVPSQDITILGSHIEKGKLCLINAWAIHRDPNLWEDPLKFRPERFDGLKSEEYKYSWIPFGLGRRACPGASLANRVIGLCLANLIQCFDWETIDGKEVDLSEGVGLTMPMAKPLYVMCKPRQSMINVLAKM